MREKKEVKKLNVFQWILYAGIIPLFFGLILFVIIVTLTGDNGLKEVKNIPVIGTLFEKDEPPLVTNDYKKQLEQYEAKLKESKEKIKDYELQIEKKDQEISTLQEELRHLQENDTDTEGNVVESAKDRKPIVKTYEKMSPKNAAAILIEMNEEAALDILSNVKEDTLAQILAKMPPENAAKFTTKLAERP